MKNKITILMGLALAAFMISCESLTPTVTSTDAETIIEDELMSLKSMEIGEGDSQELIFGINKPNFRVRDLYRLLNNDCIGVTVNADEFPKEIILDYGDGCTGRHGALVTGKIIITLSDNIFNEGAEHVLTYENVTINGLPVELSKTKTNKGQNEEGNWVIESGMEMVITYEDGSTSSRNTFGKTEWLDGFGTQTKLDDIFLRSGNGYVVTSEGAEYTRDITTPLLFDRSCLYIKSGVIELNRDGTEIIIDFGDGECDRWATKTVDGESEEIDLSKRGKKMRGFKKKH